MATWQPADPAIAAECERLFQAGGPRVYLRPRNPSHAGDLRPSQMSAARMVSNYAEADETVLARRKTGQRYAWFSAAGNPGK